MPKGREFFPPFLLHRFPAFFPSFTMPMSPAIIADATPQIISIHYVRWVCMNSSKPLPPMTDFAVSSIPSAVKNSAAANCTFSIAVNAENAVSTEVISTP